MASDGRGGGWTRRRGAPVGRAFTTLAGLAMASPLYRLTLQGRVPDRLCRRIADPWAGDADAANDMFHGRYAAAGHEVRTDGQPPWRIEPPSQAWAAELHAFGWLRDFAAAEGDAAAESARELVASWIAECSAHRMVSWRPDILGRRIQAWAFHAPFLLAGAGDGFGQEFLASLARQARHLARAHPFAPEGAPRIAALSGMIAAGIVFENDSWRHRGLDRLEGEIARQVRGDGGHVERNPSLHLGVLRDLVGVRAGLAATAGKTPAWLATAIEAMARMVRLFRHGDGRLALFNGAGEESDAVIEATLAAADGRGEPPEFAPDSGFERLSAGRALILVDTGPPPPEGLNDRAHAGCLSFEMCVGRERVIVNCGACAGADGAWREAIRATAAHSTLTIANTNSANLAVRGRSRRAPRHIARTRNAAGEPPSLTASHDGYAALFGLVHRRTLSLDAIGDELVGEDRVMPAEPIYRAAGAHSVDRPLALRFHLHPEVRVSLVRGGKAALLRLPGGTGWTFEAAAGTLGLEDSVYLGGADGVRRSTQIVVSGTVHATPAIVWSLRRLRKQD